MMFSKKLGWAIVGLGGLSSTEIAPALQRAKNSQLAALVTGSPEKSEEWKDRYGLTDSQIYRYEDFDRLAEDPTVDVVYIVTPNALHKEHAIRAARAGKHVFCEKPMGNDAADCLEMMAACEIAGVQLGMAYRCQLDPHHQEAIRFCREKTFGAVRHIEVSFGFRISPDVHSRLKRDLSKGGALLDVGVYCVQACRYLTGEEPTEVIAIESKSDPVIFAEVDDTVVWSMKFASGITANCMTSFSIPDVDEFRVIAENGSFGMRPAFACEVKPQGWTSDPAHPLHFAPIDQFAVQMDAFSQAIMEGRPFEIGGGEGLKDHLVMDAIYRSIASGKMETVDIS